MNNFNLDSLLERLTAKYGNRIAQQIYTEIVKAIKKK